MLDEDPKPKRGGYRKNAGRPKTSTCHDSPHRVRPSLSPRHPAHVVLRLRRGLPRLRAGRYHRAMRRVLRHFLGRTDFRIVHISIQSNHLHFIIEAADRRALIRNMQSLAIRAARAINAAFGGRCGKVFAHRYHATQITTARQARNTLAYVLNNWRKHREDLPTRRTREARLDPYASGFAFDGWSGVRRFRMPDGYEPLPVSRPATQLMKFDWQLFGRIGLFEVPGPVW